MTKVSRMTLHLLPISTRALAIVAPRNHLALDCEINVVDLGRGDQLTPEYRALNPNRKVPTLQDGEFVLWESKAILFYMAAQSPESGLRPADLQDQADVLRWPTWQSTHLDAESYGMVSFERGSKAVLGFGAPDAAINLAQRPA